MIESCCEMLMVTKQLETETLEQGLLVPAILVPIHSLGAWLLSLPLRFQSYIEMMYLLCFVLAVSLA